MAIEIDGWSLYPNDSSDAAIKAVEGEAWKYPMEMAKAAKGDEIKITVKFDPVPDDCDKLRWFGRMLVKAFRKINADEAAAHFEHWMSGNGDQGAPQLTEATIRETADFKRLVAEFKTKCCGAGAAETGQRNDCSEYGENWARHVLLGGYIIYWDLAARGADNCCVAKIRLDDPYDFHFGQSATFKRKVERDITKAGVTVHVKAEVTFTVPDEVMTKLKECADENGRKPADFNRRLEFTERICCDAATGTGTGGGTADPVPGDPAHPHSGTGTGTTPGSGTSPGSGGTTPDSGTTPGAGSGGATPGSGSDDQPRMSVIEIYDRVNDDGVMTRVSWTVSTDALEMLGLSDDEFAAGAFQLISLTNEVMAEAVSFGEFVRLPVEPGPRVVRLMSAVREVLAEGMTVEEYLVETAS